MKSNFYVDTSISTDGINYPSVSIYFFGCDKPVKCKGCHNESLWNFTKEKDDIELMISKMEKEYLKVNKYFDKISICFLGGEPLADQHINSVKEISKYFKNKYPNDIITIVYSWRTHEIVEQEGKQIYLDNVDYCKYGEYDEKLKNDKGFLATSNQYFYNNHTNKKIEKGEVI